MPDDPLAVLTDQVIAIRGIVERLAMQYTAMRQSIASLEHRVMQQTERFDQIEQALAAIKDLLDRPDAH